MKWDLIWFIYRYINQFIFFLFFLFFWFIFLISNNTRDKKRDIIKIYCSSIDRNHYDTRWTRTMHRPSYRWMLRLILNPVPSRPRRATRVMNWMNQTKGVTNWTKPNYMNMCLILMWLWMPLPQYMDLADVYFGLAKLARRKLSLSIEEKLLLYEKEDVWEKWVSNTHE